MNNNMKLARVQLQSKSLGLGVFLTLFFGGWGLLYVSIPLGIIATIIEVILWISVFAVVGIILLPIAHIVFVIVAILLINSHNNKLIAALDDE